MQSTKSRIDIAREGFMKKEKDLSLAAHTKKTIQASINHKEGHKTSFNLPEIILGGQDGLVNVLGVILGVAAATGDTRIVVIAGLAATFAESISMGAVAYTATLAEVDYYHSEHEREKWEIEHFPKGEKEEVRSLYKRYGFKGDLLEKIVDTITSDKKVWLEVMMNQELKLEPVDRGSALQKAFIVGISAVIGSFIPLTPYFLFSVKDATVVSLFFSAFVLFAIGYYKARVTLGRKLISQGLQMMVIGMVSAIVGYFIGTLFKITGF
ncbi:VIT1/CCC1 transporter family protein [Candidatus Gottesmanbacteria bacterium]|nr:VIT1/CCC1 transporter family protein [Candidatus Gottesmanbacteria bacterium]